MFTNQKCPACGERLEMVLLEGDVRAACVVCGFRGEPDGFMEEDLYHLQGRVAASLADAAVDLEKLRETVAGMDREVAGYLAGLALHAAIDAIGKKWASEGEEVRAIIKAATRLEITIEEIRKRVTEPGI